MSKTKLMMNKNHGYMGLANFDMSKEFLQKLECFDDNLKRIKIPKGKGTMFKILDKDLDKLNSIKEISAVILYHYSTKTFYSLKNNERKIPLDYIILNQTPKVTNTYQTPINFINKFNNGANISKFYKNKRKLYLLRENETFPIILLLPTSSNKEFSRYIKTLISEDKKLNYVVTKFSLKKVVNKHGSLYSKVEFKIDRVLTNEEITIIKNFSDQIKLQDQVKNLEIIAESVKFVD